MGSGASAGVAAAARSASAEDLRAALAGLSSEAKAKLAASLGEERRPPPPPQPLRDVQADGSRSCAARVQAALDAIAARQGEVNACCEVLAELALKQAAEADARLAGGAARRPLEGVPILVKVNIDVAGTLSTASMPGLEAWRPESTAPIVGKLVDAGAIVVAKTNMPEAALGAWGFSPVHGTTKNPRNARYTCGGSSSGTAAGIAAGMAACGLGSDTGGSLRIPAECCGVVGMRPSKGRYPRSGVVPCMVDSDTPGVMAATVADLAVLDAVIAGEPLADYRPAGLSGLGVAVPADMSADAHPGNRRALDLAVSALSKSGALCKTDGVDFRPLTTCKHETPLGLNEKGLRDYLASHPSCKSTAEEILERSAPMVKRLFEQSPDTNAVGLSPDEYKERREKYDAEQLEWEARYAKYFADNGVDVVLTPCTAGPPPALQTEQAHADFMATFKNHALLLKCTGDPTFNELRIPSIAVPTAARHEGLEGAPMPAGILLWGKPEDDKRLIQVAMALELALQ